MTAHQPVYLPGIIFFNKLVLSDACMLLSHCQFVPHSWHQRNRIRNQNAPLWLSVSVNAHFKDSIVDVQLDSRNWRRKHLGSLRQAYANRPYFERYFAEIERLISADYPSLADLNIALLKQLCKWLEIDTPLHDSRKLGLSGQKTDLLIEVCNALGANSFLSNVGSRVYVDEPRMVDSGVTHFWQHFRHPVYEQGARFLPDLSVLDLLFNVGPEAQQLVRASGTIESVPPGEIR